MGPLLGGEPRTLCLINKYTAAIAISGIEDITILPADLSENQIAKGARAINTMPFSLESMDKNIKEQQPG